MTSIIVSLKGDTFCRQTDHVAYMPLTLYLKQTLYAMMVNATNKAVISEHPFIFWSLPLWLL